MYIHLYNNFHNGDLFLNQPVIKNLCKNNPQLSFTMFCKYNSFIFKDIDNLTTIIAAPYPDLEVYKVIDYETIAINLWIFPLHIFNNIQLKDIECNIQMYVKCFKNLLNEIKMRHNISINIDDFDYREYIPIIPDCNINDFLLWNKCCNNGKKLILYYNYTAKSGQSIPISSHDNMIIRLSESLPNYTIIICRMTESIINYLHSTNNTYSNIISCDISFSCLETQTCENLCRIEKIAEYCDYSIHFDIGACFYYVNNNTYTSKNIPLHICNNPFYFKSLLSSFEILQQKCKMIEVQDENEAYLKLINILNS